MNGLMMNTPLTITSLMNFAEKLNPNAEIVSITADQGLFRYRYRDAFRRTRKLANALERLGMQAGDCIGTMAWNDHRHFELYYAVSCAGAVIHTINPRLFPEQINYIINHAEDQWLFIDAMFVPLLEAVQEHLTGVKGYIILSDDAHMPDTKLENARSYESLIADESEDYAWPELDENTASALCYTSGTTGNPKGVMYSHRSTVLHTYASCLPDSMNISSKDSILPVVPMFHVNAWGIPYSAPMVGAKLVLPGPKMGDGEALADLINSEQVTMSAAVPTIWLALLAHLEGSGKTVDSLNSVVVGGAACPLSVMQAFEAKYGTKVYHAWGMTEMSPLGTLNRPTPDMADYSTEEREAVMVKQGRNVFGVDMKIVDDENRELPWNGKDFGLLKVRGPWICSSYFKLDGSDAHDKDGWFSTGDVATIDEKGFMQITDRAKDVIKSGGEWISSIDLENTAVDHPDIAEAAVIGLPHPKWSERPLLVAVRKPGADIDAQTLLAFFEGKVAKWWIPEDAQFVEELPHTATGKLQKVKLREQFKDYNFPGFE